MEIEYLGTLNTEASEQFGSKFTANMCKTLKANKHDISVVECIKIGVDIVNEQNTIVRAEQSRAEQSRAEQSRAA